MQAVKINMMKDESETHNTALSVGLVPEPAIDFVDRNAVLPEQLFDEAEQIGNTDEVGCIFLLLILSNIIIYFLNQILLTDSKALSERSYFQ